MLCLQIHVLFSSSVPSQSYFYVGLFHKIHLSYTDMQRECQKYRCSVHLWNFNAVFTQAFSSLNDFRTDMNDSSLL